MHSQIAKLEREFLFCVDDRLGIENTLAGVEDVNRNVVGVVCGCEEDELLDRRVEFLEPVLLLVFLFEAVFELACEEFIVCFSYLGLAGDADC